MRNVPLFDGFAADSSGNIHRVVQRGHRWKPSQMAAGVTPNGYVWCNARASHSAPDLGIRKGARKQAHVLVCLAFHGLPPSGKHEPHHINGVRHDNRPENLMWVTRAENNAFALAAGTMKRGSASKDAKLTEDAVRHIRAASAARAMSQAALAALYKVSPGTIQSAIDRRSWRHVE